MKFQSKLGYFHVM